MMSKKYTLGSLILLAALYISTAVVQAAPANLADRHAQRGATCASCHGDAPPSSTVPMNNCLKCHGGSYEALAKRTDGGDLNFHASHLEEAYCGECHSGHHEPRLACNECHDFKAKVP